ncbi:MFS transporter [Geosporobacter ferrireducens]|uniref:Major facilitator superfamily (MFS) profile domain-containing protein n=1 Tax=Geosporobacter ferrireducens TaxID=1424294 RepID=A0A1D8GD81_9FIRM|nr:MFS transporter [Geosporobacter ferrireducens]AOT68868.1 hypothetical protein Gferi_04435 [Geosporobacter ferrireducens]
MKNFIKNKNFTFILGGKLISLLGNAVYQISLTWYILSLPGSNNGKILSWVMVFGLAPAVVSGTMLGGFVDRYNKKKIMIYADILSGSTVLLLTYLLFNQLLTPIHILLATCVLSISTATLSIAVRSMIPEILNFEELQWATSSNLLVERFTNLLGMIFGGILVSLLGVPFVFLLNGMSFLFSALFESFIHYECANRFDENQKQKFSYIQDFREISAYLSKNIHLVTLLFLFTFVNFLWDPLFAIVTPYVLKTDFDITPLQFGIIEGGFGMGFCIATLCFSKYPKLIAGKRIIFFSIFSINTAIFLFSAPLLLSLTVTTYTFFYFAIMLMITGVFSAALNIRVATYFQEMIPESLRGKFHGISTSLSLGLIPLAGIIIGNLIGKIPSSAFFITSCLLVYGLIFFVPSISRITKDLQGEELSPVSLKQ